MESPYTLWWVEKDERAIQLSRQQHQEACASPLKLMFIHFALKNHDRVRPIVLLLVKDKENGRTRTPKLYIAITIAFTSWFPHSFLLYFSNRG